MQVMRGAIAILVLLAAGCSSPDDGRGEGPVLTSVGGDDDWMAAIVAGRLTFQNDCLLLGGMPVVWPESTNWDADSQALTLPGGDVVQVGARLTGGGGFLRSRHGRTSRHDVAAAAKSCLGTTGEVAVFNPGSDVEVES